MKKKLCFAILFITGICSAQSVIQTVNSGSLITPATAVSIGEIVINPTQNQSISGLIGILAQVNQQQFEVAQFELSDNVVAFPNPTVAKLYFKSSENLSNEVVLFKPYL